MTVFLNSLYESLVDKSPQHLVMALFAALAGALVLSQIYFFVSKKVSDPQVVLTGVMIFAMAFATVIGVGLERYARDLATFKNIAPASYQQHARRTPHSSFDVQIVRRIMEVADTDRDGRLSPQEAALAASKNVRDANTQPSDSDSIDFRTLTRLVRVSIMAPPPPSRLTEFHQTNLTSDTATPISMKRPFGKKAERVTN
ncbi:hypothetical protein [Singulisphaera sp. PoT]|uniref:hypothetical protein n=1 Tax=Singulisphaera sp. PoT TaxID=3411797 RepID=UPI003BF4FC0F